jgi:hypothetical protein
MPCARRPLPRLTSALAIRSRNQRAESLAHRKRRSQSRMRCDQHVHGHWRSGAKHRPELGCTTRVAEHSLLVSRHTASRRASGLCCAFAPSRGPEDQGRRRSGGVGTAETPDRAATPCVPPATGHGASTHTTACYSASRPALYELVSPARPGLREPRRAARCIATTSSFIDHVPGLSLTRSIRAKGHVVNTQPCTHPVGMRRLALAQAPAFRAAGGATARVERGTERYIITDQSA